MANGKWSRERLKRSRALAIAIPVVVVVALLSVGGSLLNGDGTPVTGERPGAIAPPAQSV